MCHTWVHTSLHFTLSLFLLTSFSHLFFFCRPQNTRQRKTLESETKFVLARFLNVLLRLRSIFNFDFFNEIARKSLRRTKEVSNWKIIGKWRQNIACFDVFHVHTICNFLILLFVFFYFISRRKPNEKIPFCLWWWYTILKLPFSASQHHSITASYPH